MLQPASFDSTNVNAPTLVVALLAFHIVLVANLLAIWGMSPEFQLGTGQIGGLVLFSTLSFPALS